MISKELAKKIKYLEITTSKAVNDVLAGQYHSVFKGQGMEFDEVREYSAGDDVRSIDWNVTARMGKPFIKRYVEERELTILFLVDLSGSGSFGSAEQTKGAIAAELSALLAFSAIKNNDKVGLISFTDEVEQYLPPKKGASYVLRLMTEVMSARPTRKETDISAALDFLARVAHRRCVVFLISDFLAEGYERSLTMAARKHDLIAISVTDPRELELPSIGLVELQDAETGEVSLIDTGSSFVRTAYKTNGLRRLDELRKQFRREKIDHIEVTAGDNYVRDLVKFFRAREARR